VKHCTKIERLPPLKDEDFGPEHAEAISRFKNWGPLVNVTRSWLRHPRSLEAYNTFTVALAGQGGELGRREQELLFLRTAWRARAPYPFSRHRIDGVRAGLTEAEVEALKRPVDAHPWSAADEAMILATDELLTDFNVSDDVWLKLTAQFSERQVIEVILAAGRYCILCMLANSAGVELEEDRALDSHTLLTA
jgi:4-carboxymuconolactone decarboxylase